MDHLHLLLSSKLAAVRRRYAYIRRFSALSSADSPHYSLVETRVEEQVGVYYLN